MITFQLPPERSKLGLPNQGWTISTEVKQSLIAGSGNGRFAKESVAGSSRVMVKKLVPMETVTKLSDLTGDSTVTFSSEEDLEKYIQFADSEAGLTHAQILDLYEIFCMVWMEVEVVLTSPLTQQITQMVMPSPWN